jgi:radical SAM superfamily enzyme
MRRGEFGLRERIKTILRSLNKRFQPEEVRSISKHLKDHGIGRMGFLLLGGPGETKETVLESLSFADSLKLEAVKVTTGIRIYPQTKLSLMAIEEGLIANGEDLLFPTFYLARNLDGWLQETACEWIGKRPNWHT